MNLTDVLVASFVLAVLAVCVLLGGLAVMASIDPPEPVAEDEER